MQDFTLTRYRALVTTLVSRGYRPVPLVDFFRKEYPDTGCILLRHDVDRNPARALRMAELEHGLGIRSSYYFRYPSTFDPTIIRTIASLGHEIGYHYEVMAKTRGDPVRAGELFFAELSEFRKICGVTTCCAHGSPLSSYDNRTFFSSRPMSDFQLIGDALLSVSGEIPYFTDTGRTWGMHTNLRDRLASTQAVPDLVTTDDLEHHLIAAGYPLLYIVAHPERWNDPGLTWYAQFCRDQVTNLGKRVLRAVR